MNDSNRSPLRLWRYLLADKMATTAAVWLCILVLGMIVGLTLVQDHAVKMNLAARNLAPFSLETGWLYTLGADSLGRPILARLMVASTTTLGIALASVLVSLVIGTLIGVVAGFFGGWVGALFMRLGDVILSFPLMLLALVVLFVLGPSLVNLVIVMALTRMPVYARVARAEVLEIRERLFVDASRALGARPSWILWTHILPLVAPTLLTTASVNLAIVMLFESGLSFLGLGVQPPSVSWGLMVAQGRAYLSQAWWLACFPGLAIMLTTMAFNILSSWFRTVTDPAQRWRLERRT
ncbi:MAG: ABC transporter permease [Rhizobium sp.]|nr:ABC transporter permease [Rhizobium sp.]